jgi:protein gp37
MGTRSNIEWTELTWNPVTGCTKISQGCKNCYAERMAKRLKAMGSARYRNEFDLTLLCWTSRSAGGHRGWCS